MEENIKAKFFALYLGQKVSYLGMVGELSFEPGDYNLRAKGHSFRDEAFLLLRTIDQLSDDQLLEIAVLRGYRKDHLDVVEGKELKEIIKENRLYLSTFDYKEVRACIIDYLRLNGFITPFTYLDNNTPTTLTVDDILGMGWVVKATK